MAERDGNNQLVARKLMETSGSAKRMWRGGKVMKERGGGELGEGRKKRGEGKARGGGKR